MTSWNLQTLRLGLLTLRTPHAVWLAERLRFPAAVGTTTTFLLWWLVLVPIIYTVLPARHRHRFTALNKSPLLINLHVLNLVITAVDFHSWPRRLTELDLWVGVAVALGYMVFYLLALDRRGVQLYIVRRPAPIPRPRPPRPAPVPLHCCGADGRPLHRS